MTTDLIHAFLSESADDEGNARCVLAAVGDEFCYSSAFGWMHWTGTHWRPDPAEAAVDQAVMAVIKRRRREANEANQESIVKVTHCNRKRVADAKALFRSLVTVEADEFDVDSDTINVANGVLNLRTGKLTPHSPTARFTYCIDVPYDPNADSSVWLAFLADVVQDDENMLDYLRMAVGYTLTGHTSEECLWYIHGPSRSGKGAFTETLLRLFGAPLGVEVDFATFTAKREGDTQNFDLAPLKPARLVVTSESNRYEQLNTGKVKSLTGGNYIRCAYKHRAHFTYRPQFKAWLVSNHPVSADVEDEALWYRVKVVLFPNSHIGKEDKHLKARLSKPAVLAGVLRWAVEGAQAWYRSPDGLVHPKAIAINTNDQRRELDMVQAWLDERCEDGETYTAYSVIYADYSGWCKDNGVEPKKAKTFTQALKGKGYSTELKRLGGDVMRVVMGLRLG